MLMCNNAIEEQEVMLRERAAILEAEMRRLSGELAFTTDEVRAMLGDKDPQGDA